MPSKLLRYRDIFLVDLLSLILLPTILLTPTFPLRAVLGAVFVLFFPGYMLVSALFPRRGDLDVVERIALSIGLSLAVVPLLGLILNYTPWGIRLTPVTLTILLFTLSMSAASAWRRSSLPAWEAYNPPIGLAPLAERWRGLGSERLLVAGLIVGVVVAGALTAHFASTPRVGERFTEFYVLGPDGKIADYPTSLVLGEPGKVILGIVNHEYGEANYSVEVRLEGETLASINGISLNHGERWEQPYVFTPNRVGDKMKLEFLLYKDGGLQPYRKLHLWISVEQP